MTLRRLKLALNPAATLTALVLMLALLVPVSGCAAPTVEADGAEAASAGKTDSETAPDFTLSDLEGHEFSLASTGGQVLLIDFWATWCAPCREELPMLQHLSDTYGEQGFTVLGISDEDADVLREFVEKEGISYRNLVDPGDVSEQYMVLGLPTGFLIDRDGKIVERYTGPKPTAILERRIKELLDAPPAT